MIGALAAVAAVLPACQQMDLAGANVAGVPDAGPLPKADWGSPVTVNGKTMFQFTLDDGRLDALRAAVSNMDLVGKLVINPDPNALPPNCHGGTEHTDHGDVSNACLTLEFASGHAPQLNPAFVEGINPFVLPVSVDIPLDIPTVESIALLKSGGPGDTVKIDLVPNPGRVGVKSFDGQVGVYIPFALELPGTTFTQDFSCQCLNTTTALPNTRLMPSCADACQAIEDKGGSCNLILARSRINRIPLEIGFIPRSQPPAIQTGGWVSKFANKNLPLDFSVDVHVGAPKPTALLASSDTFPSVPAAFAAVAADDVDDMALAMDTSGCSAGTNFACWLGLAPDCEQTVTDLGFQLIVSEFLGGKLAPAIESQVAPLFTFEKEGTKPLPKPCNLTDPTAPGGQCTTNHDESMLRTSMTYQKIDWFSSVFGPFPNGGTLKVVNVAPLTIPTPEVEPGQKAIVMFTFDPDQDNDGVLADVDNCDHVWNPGQEDKDKDGIGDACDPCPCDPDNDSDHDGFCTITCDGTGQDNCAHITNVKQENCNAVSEQFHTPGDVRGDLCDPVPCPEARSVTNGYNPVYDKASKLSCGTVYQNAFDIRPLKSRSTDDSTVSVSVPKVPTHARFCQQDLALGITCDESYDIRDERLADAQCSAGCALPEAKWNHFHRMTFEGTVANGKDPDGPPAVLDYDHTNSMNPLETWTWSYAADTTRWVQTGVINPVTPGELQGTFWTHADTPVGDPTAGAAGDVGTGTHGAELANHHELHVVPQRFACSAATNVVMGPIHPYFIWRDLPDPPPPLDRTFSRIDAQRGEASAIVPLPEEAAWGAVDTTGTALFMTERLGRALQRRLEDGGPLVWANAVEPFLRQGRGASFPMAIALSADGSGVIDTVTTDGSFLLAEGDRDARSSEPDGKERIGPRAEQFQVVLSRVRGGVFVVGGQRPDTGELTGEIWFSTVGDGPARWNLVSIPGYQPREVLAATYDFATDALYVLEDVRDDGLTHLVAIDLRSRSAEDVATWRTSQAFDEHALVVQTDGSLLIAESSSARSTHRLVRVDVTSAGSRPGLLVDDGVLAVPPIVDGAGMTRVVRSDPWADELTVRRKDVSFTPSDWSDIVDP